MSRSIRELLITAIVDVIIGLLFLWGLGLLHPRMRVDGNRYWLTVLWLISSGLETLWNLFAGRPIFARASLWRKTFKFQTGTLIPHPEDAP